MDEIQKTNLVGKANQLLDAIVESTDAMKPYNLNEQKLKEIKLVLGFLNACNNVINTKLKYFKMVGVDKKIEAVKERSKKV
jgi:hypothetical protein